MNNQPNPESDLESMLPAPPSPYASTSELFQASTSEPTFPDCADSALPAPCSELLFAYTRAMALADGEQVEVTTTAAEAGIRFPVYLTRAVWNNYVAVPAGVSGQDEAGRLWDLVWLLRHAIRRSRPGVDRIPVGLYVRNDNRRALPVKLIATCGPRDIDDPQPAITLMMPGED